MTLRSCFLSSFVEFRSAVSEEKSKMSLLIRGQGRHFFSDRREKHKLRRGRWDLASFQVSLIPFSGFRGEVENVSVNQRPGQPSCFSSDRHEKHKLGRGHWDIASFQVSFNSGQWFQMRSRKYEKLTTDGRRTTRDHNSALEPSAQVH